MRVQRKGNPRGRERGNTISEGKTSLGGVRKPEGAEVGGGGAGLVNETWRSGQAHREAGRFHVRGTSGIPCSAQDHPGCSYL